MNHPLDGARLKIIRAQEHLDSLKTHILMYLHELPYEFRPEKYGDLQEPIFMPIITTQPPVRLGTVIGDCVNNARAALDYVAWELATKYFDPPFDVTKSDD